ncbi:MAG: Ig-like domain-containing protein [bacterium]|nr:Ig-like domain-containing protein [bacterium]
MRMNNYGRWLATVGLILIGMSLAACNPTDSDDDNTVVLETIEVTPANPFVAAGTTRQFAATGHYSDDSAQDLTTQATWVSSNTLAGTIDNTEGSIGLATALDTGTSTITASLGDIDGSTLLTVGSPPETPTDLVVGNETRNSLALSWVGSPEVTVYQVYRDVLLDGDFTDLIYEGADLTFTDTDIGAHYLESIRMFFAREAIGATFAFTIYEGEGESGAVLYSEDVSGGPWMDWITYTLTTPVPVNSGVLHTYRMQGNVGGGYDGTCLGWMTENPYPGGRGDNGEDEDYSFATSVRSDAKTYYYKVRTINPFGESGYSQAVEGATLAAVVAEDQIQDVHVMYKPSDNDCWQSFTVLRN